MPRRSRGSPGISAIDICRSRSRARGSSSATITSSPPCSKAWARACAASKCPSRRSAAPTMRRRITMTTETALYRLMTWLSPSYPVGAFSYSHGLEYAIEAALVRDGDGLAEWIATVLEAGAGVSDGALLAAAWSAAKVRDDAALDEVAALAQA